jgi:hypothetical protein
MGVAAPSFLHTAVLLMPFGANKFPSDASVAEMLRRDG